MSGNDPVDPDLDPSGRPPDSERSSRSGSGPVLAAIATGGVIGAEARYGIDLLLPHRDGSFPWSTIVINASGCVLIGVLMVMLLEVQAEPHRLARPFLGVGVLGGYTTFSTFALDAVQLAHHSRIAAAALYVVATVVTCASAVVLGAAGTRAATSGRGRPG